MRRRMGERGVYRRLGSPRKRASKALIGQQSHPFGERITTAIAQTGNAVPHPEENISGSVLDDVKAQLHIGPHSGRSDPEQIWPIRPL